jgi:hypothetical protein
MLQHPKLTATQLSNAVVYCVVSKKWAGIAYAHVLYPFHFDFKQTIYNIDGDFEDVHLNCKEQLRYFRQDPILFSEDEFDTEVAERLRNMREFIESASRL